MSDTPPPTKGPMTLTFISDSPLNSTVVDLHRGAHLYDIATKIQFKSQTYKSTTTVHDSRGNVVAVWDRAHRREQDRIVYHDKMHTLAEWLPKKSVLSKTRMLVAPDGERYHWKQTSSWGSSVMKLIHPETQHVVAQVRSARTGAGILPSKDRRMSISIQPEATGMVDVILLSFIIVDQMRREQTAASFSGAGLAAARGYGVAAGGGINT